MNQPSLHIILFAVLVTATVTDLQRSKIPNWLTLPAIVIGLGSHALANGPAGFLYSVQGLGIGLALFLILHLLGGLGAGDVKLVAAVGSLIGPSEMISAVIAIGLVSGLCAIGLMLGKWGWRNTILWAVQVVEMVVGMLPALPQPPGERLSLRFGPVIALGTILSQFGLFSHVMR